MKKAVKVGIIFVAVLLFLSIAGSVFVSRLIDPDQLKGRITALVKERTGRDLTLTGDVSLSIFPWLGITIGPLSLSNPPGFDTAPFLSLTEANVRVKLLPLLSRKVVTDVITLRGLSVALIRNTDGRTNWEDFLKPSTAPSSQPGETPPAEKGVLMALAGVDIQNASVDWADHLSGKQVTVQNFTATLSAINQTDPASATITFDLHQRDGISASVEASARILADPKAEQYSLENLAFKAILKGKPIPSESMTLTGKGNLSLGPQGVDLKKMTLEVDGMNATGEAGLHQEEGKTACTFEVQVNELDLNRYLSGKKAVLPSPPQSNAEPTPKGEPKAASISLPSGFAIEGRLGIGKLKIANFHFSDVDIKPTARDGKVTAPIAASLYGGSLAGVLSLEARSNIPQIALTGKLSNVAVERLLLDLQGKSPITGSADADWTLTGAGRTQDALLRTLDGPFTFKLKDGSITGIDAEKICRTLAAAASGSHTTQERIGSALSLLAKPKPTAEAKNKTSDSTKFSEMRGSLLFAKGVGTTKDLSLESPLMRLQGSGHLDLVNKRLVFETTASIAKSCEGQSKKTDEAPYTVPVTIRGPLNDPDIEVDITTILNTLSWSQSKETRKPNASGKPEDAVKELLRNILK